MLRAEDHLKQPASDSYYNSYINICMGAEGYKRIWNKQCDYETNPLIEEECFE